MIGVAIVAETYKAEYDALTSRLQDKAMRLNELGIMSDAAYHRFEDVWATGVYYTDDRLI